MTFINRLLARGWPALLLLGLLSACGQPPVVLQRYLLEYPPPALQKTPVPDSLRVELFAAPQYLRSTNMLYQPRPYEIKAYAYHRWQVEPAAMVTDLLVRDLRESGLFQGIFSYSQGGTARYRVEGAVQEFAEVDDPGGWLAVVAVSVTLLDLTQAELSRRVILSRNYRETELMEDQTPTGLAAAMSRAWARLSSRIIADLHEAARRASGCN